MSNYGVQCPNKPIYNSVLIYSHPIVYFYYIICAVWVSAVSIFSQS